MLYQMRSYKNSFHSQVAANVKPSLVIFVMDGSIGQAAFDQAKAFKDAVEVCGTCVCALHVSLARIVTCHAPHGSLRYARRSHVVMPPSSGSALCRCSSEPRALQ